MENYFSLSLIVSCTTLSVYLFYTYLYRSYKLNKAGVVVFDCQRDIPSFAYLMYRFTAEALCKRQGKLYPNNGTMAKVTFTVYNCRLKSKEVRWFCSAFGYGWDYPDSSFRDIPLCFPELLIFRLLAMVVCSDRFRLSPLGLVRVRQILRTHQPIDEIKKRPFLLQASVMEYRTVEEGVEVDIKLAADDSVNQPVWENLVTLLSRDMKRITSKPPPAQGLLEAEEIRAVQMSVSWSTGLRCAWASGDCFLLHLFTMTTKLLGYGRPVAPSLWMLSKCLAEIEKHRGVDAVRAPVRVRVWFNRPLSVPGRTVIRFWETAPEATVSSRALHGFQMEEQSTGTPCVVGEISEWER